MRAGWLVIGMLLAMPFGASGFPVEVGGHLKASGRRIHYEAEDGRASLDTSHDLEGTADFRLTSRTRFTGSLFLDLDYEWAYRGGEATRRRFDLAQAGIVSMPDGEGGDRLRLFDLTATVSESSHHQTLHRLDRMALGWEAHGASLRVGRQAVSWGGGLLFNPMDLVSSFSPTDVSRDYKSGEDMVFFGYTHETGHEIQMIGRPGRDALSERVTTGASTYALKMHGASGVFETDILVGQHRGFGILGVGCAGYLQGAAWRYDLIASDEAGGAFSGVANIDLSWVGWGKNWYGFLEFYQNGFGSTHYAEALADPSTRDRLARGEVFVLGKHYLATRLQLEAHPLVNLSLTCFANVHDPSGIFQPSLVWDAGENLRMDMGAILPWGAEQTEFGGFLLPGGAEVVPAREFFITGTRFF